MNMVATPLMPIILTNRQEAFCQQIAVLKSPTEAYRIAYGASDKQAQANGPRMMRSDRIKARIAQIQEAESAARRVTLPFLTGALRRIGLSAEGSGQHGAAVAAVMGIAKLHGFLIDRQQVDLLVRRPSASPESPDEMSETEWLARHGALIEHNPEVVTVEPEGSASTSCDTMSQGQVEREPE